MRPKEINRDHRFSSFILCREPQSLHQKTIVQKDALPEQENLFAQGMYFLRSLMHQNERDDLCVPDYR